jgi:hypothetical protein
MSAVPTESSSSAAEVVRRMYDAFSRGDVEAILGLAAPDVVIYQSPSVPWGGRRSGAEGLQHFLGSLISTIRSAVETGELYDDGDGHVVQSGRTRGEVIATGVPFDVAETHVWTVADGLVQRFDSYIDVAAMRRALDAEPAEAGAR